MFIARRFPDHIAFHAVGGPTYITSVVAVASRMEFRDQTSGIGLGRWTISQNAKLRNTYRELLSFFRIARGRENTFPFKDWNDFEVTAAEGRLIATGASNKYQMYKRYTVANLGGDSPDETYTEDRMIKLPVFGKTFVVGGTGTAIDYETGIVTSSSQPTYWYGEFDNLCRFDIDQMEAEIVDKRGDGQFITSWGTVPIFEVLQ